MHSRLLRRISRTFIAVAMIGFAFSPATASAAGEEFVFATNDLAASNATVLEGSETLSPQDVPEEALPASVAAEATEVQVEESGDGELGRRDVDPFRMVGVTWAEDPDVADVQVKIQVRTNGEWSEWLDLPINDIEIGRPGTEPMWLDEPGDGVAVQIEAGQGTPNDVQVSTIDPDANPEADTNATTQSASFAPATISTTEMEETNAVVSASVSQPTIITRAGWGASNGLWGTSQCKAPAVQSKALGVVLHHTAGSNTAKKADSQSIIKGYQTYHVQGHGWCDIGYAFLIDRWGQIFEGRKGGITKQVTGAHAGVTSVNKDATGIAMMGNFDVAEPPAAMKDATVRLAAWRMSLFGNNPKGTYTSGGKSYKVLNGHRDVKATACPGRYGYRWLNESGGMRDRVAALVASGTQPPSTPTALKATNISSLTADFSWSADSAAARYKIWWRPVDEPAARIAYSTTPTFTVTGLKPRQEAIIGVASENAAGDISLRTPMLSFRAAPEQASGLKATSISTSAASFSWDAKPGAVKYKIWWRPVNEAAARILYTDKTSYTVSGLAAGTEAIFGVAAVDSNDSVGLRTPMLSFTTTSTAPSQVSGLKATELKTDSASFSWNAVSGAVKYKIWWRPVDDPKARIVYSTTPNFTVKGLDPSTSAIFGVAAVDANDLIGLRSPMLNFKTAAPAPAKVGGLKTTKVDSNSATFTWTAVPGAVQYKIWWRPVDDPKARIVYSTSPTYTVTGLKADTQAIFGAAAIDSKGVIGLRSDMLTFKTSKAASSAIPAQVSGLKADNVTANSADFTWSTVPGAVRYKIWWRPVNDPVARIDYTTGTTYSLTSLDSSQDLIFGVAAENDEGEFGLRSPMLDFRTLPTQVAGMKLTSVTSTSAAFSWAGVPSAKQYKIWWRPVDDPKVRIIYSATPNYVITGLPANMEAIFGAAAIDDKDLIGLRSPMLTFRTSPATAVTTPARVEGVTATAVAATTASFSWTPVAGAVKYKIWWRPVNDPKARIVYSNTPNYTVTGIEPSTPAIFGVAAVNAADVIGLRSPMLDFKTDSLPPVKVTGVSVASVSSTSASFTWTAVPGAVKYKIWWRPVNDPAARIVYSTKPSITVTGIKANTEAIFGAAAINAQDEIGLRSDMVTFTTTSSGPTLKNSITVPSSGNITIKGHGYGHGIGMSQHGAQGAARQGVKYDKILSHYYPGTTLGTKTGNIRVQLTKVTNSEVKVVAVSGLKFRKLSDNSVITLPTSLNGGTVTHWNIVPRSSDKKQSTLRYKVGSTWRDHSHFTGAAQFEGASITEIYHPDGSKHKYRGALRSVPKSSGSTARWAVNVLSIEHYTKGVVAREMPSGWHSEALKAQSVAARTYGARAITSSGTYDICDTTSCQVYGGVAAETSNTNTAVDGTKSKVLMYQGGLAFTQFSSSSGGWTNKGSQPYLKPVRDDWDNFSGNSVHNWTLTIKASTIQKKHTSIGTLQSMTITKRNGYGNGGGRVTSITLKGSKGSKTISGVDARWDFGMRSDWFGF